MKAVVKGEFIGIAATDNRDRKEKRKRLQDEIAELERIHQQTGAPRVWKRLKAARAQMAGLDTDRAEFAALRLRHKFYVGGDRCGRLLANRLRAQRQTHKVSEIVDQAGVIHRDETGIAGTFRQYYETLYAPQRLPADTLTPYLQNAPVTKLLQHHSDTLIAPIRPEEVIAAISKLQLN